MHAAITKPIEVKDPDKHPSESTVIQYQVALLLNNKNGQCISLYKTHALDNHYRNFDIGAADLPSTLIKTYAVPSDYYAESVAFAPDNSDKIQITMTKNSYGGALTKVTYTINTQTEEKTVSHSLNTAYLNLPVFKKWLADTWNSRHFVKK